MSAEQTRKNLNRVDNELAALEKKLAEMTKKEADLTKKSNDTKRSITKNTGATAMQSKLRQIQQYQDELVKVVSTKADINKKIADKRKTRADTALKVQKEEIEDNKKAEKIQKTMYGNYEKKIAELKFQLKSVNEQQQPLKNLYVEGNEEFDVFLSHASEDKLSIADDLCKELEDAGIKVWYDALSMKWGDSLRSKIDNGLKKSKYAIVIISKDYIKKGWTNYELDGLFQREMSCGKVILPIWHNISKKEIEDFSPTLAGRLAINTAIMTPKEIADELKTMLGLNNEKGGDENNG